MTYDGNTYTWQNGRQLAGITNSSKNQTITYKYNESGIRTQKTVNGITTNYYLDGSKVIYEQTGNNVIYYAYDENGNVIGLKYNDTQYYYIKNGQNDIVGILDSNLNQVVKYEYDSWGNILSIKDASGNNITSSTNIGIINPYRYRSYRYDTETGLYYLQSRYYNSEWGRFINFDNYGGQVGELLSHNGYIYCNNNPVNMIDEDGNFPILISAILVMIVTVVTIATLPQDTGADIGDSITGIATTIGDGISSVVSNVNNKKKVKTNTQTTTQVETKTRFKKISDDTPIYRYGGTNPGNLTPRKVDADYNSGLSFSTIRKSGAAMTTIKKINSTGVLYAIQDKPTHVSVYPVGATVEDWYNSGRNSIWTHTLKSIVIKFTQ